jgi:hypothetical protein
LSPFPIFHNGDERNQSPPEIGEEKGDFRVLDEDSNDCLERYSFRRLLVPGGEKKLAELPFSFAGVLLAAVENNARDTVVPDPGGDVISNPDNDADAKS